jgi:hypothetical protein
MAILTCESWSQLILRTIMNPVGFTEIGEAAVCDRNHTSK